MKIWNVKGVFAVAALTGVMALGAGCGVNPDRLAAMEEKNASMAEQGGGGGEESSGDASLQFEDSDPLAIRDAVMALKDMERMVAQKEFASYLDKRYEVLRMVKTEATPEIEKHSKTPLILDKLKSLDQRVARVAGDRAQQIAGLKGRTDTTSADALMALTSAFDACEDAVDTSDPNVANSKWTEYETALAKAMGADENAMTYVGPKPSGMGVVDVPAEIAVCEARMAIKRIEAEDKPPAPQDLSKSYSGCGYYPVELEAQQVGPNKFGDYQITSYYAQDADPGAAKPVPCDQMPPVSDAPSDIQDLVEENVMWFVPESDVASMAGPFKYEQKSPSEMVKQGTVRIYRRNAQLKSNQCGAKDPKITCEAEGNEYATAYNHATHYLDRANFHTQAGTVERCKEMANRAYEKANKVGLPDCSKDTVFQVKGKKRFTCAEMAQQLDVLKTKANDILGSNYCQGGK